MQIVKHVVITGASGYVGKHLLHSFLKNDHKTPLSAVDDGNDIDNDETAVVQYSVHALYGSHANFEKAVQDYAALKRKESGDDDKRVTCEIKTYSLDLTDSDAIHAWIESDMQSVQVVDVCIHLAAMSNPGQCQTHPELAQWVNTPKHFFAALREHKRCRSVIALSTDHVYPGTNPPYKEEGDENEQSLKPINMYGFTKYEMERYLLSLSSSIDTSSTEQTTSPCRVILLRSSIILGPKSPIALEQSKSTFLHFIASRKDQETLFWTDEKRNVICVGDVVAVIRFFVDNNNFSNDRGEVYNMGGPESLSRFDMAKAVFEYFGYCGQYLVPKEKGQEQAQNPSQGPPSPLDISMDSTSLQSVTGLQFSGLTDMIKVTFAEESI
ncbi:hypothetical protein ACA910_012625 [Epithemia clementina (nom. ined.)]